jgi:hypothetical protein
VNLRGCNLRITEILSRCGNLSDVQDEVVRAVLGGQPVAQRPLTLPSPTSVWRTMGPAEQAADKATITRLYQEIGDIFNTLCVDPASAGSQYEAVCRKRRQVSEIQDKYSAVGQMPPDPGKYQTSDCGWELWNESMDNRSGICFRPDKSKSWFEGRLGELHQKYHGEKPTPSGGGIKGGGQHEGGGGNCGPSCTWDGSICHCNPD